MIKLTNIKLSASADKTALLSAAAELLKIPAESIRSLEILKRSVDARRKANVCYIYSVALTTDDEDALLKLHDDSRISLYSPEQYSFPFSKLNTDCAPVIIGMGPAGLFSALCLAEAGIKCIILERGRPVEKRTTDVETFWRTGKLNTTSNVQFGEGGAGTFSDGKLTTGLNNSRTNYILRELVRFGAPEDILYLAKPHIGTDKLRNVVKNIREHLIDLGCDIRFEHRVDDLIIENGMVSGVAVTTKDGSYQLRSNHVILAPGNSARDTFRMLAERGVRLSQKNFAVGVRIEHLQQSIDLAQYGEAATLGTLPASDYKLAVHLSENRSVYTFCVCPGGQVVASASEEGGVVTNGMSEYARDAKNCNGGLLVGIIPSDVDSSPLTGMEFQIELEKAAFLHGGGNYFAPAQLVGDFLAKKPSKGHKRVTPTYMPGVKYCNLWDVLPEFICTAIAEALPQMERKIHGFADPEAVLTAVESRSSSPIRIDREDFCAVGISGLYPCGEGAGYAGGIMSAAVDGIQCAEALCGKLL